MGGTIGSIFKSVGNGGSVMGGVGEAMDPNDDMMSGGVPDAPDVVHVPISANKSPMAGATVTPKKPSLLSEIHGGVAAGIKSGGDAYSQEQNAIARSGRPVAINVQPSEIDPNLTPSGDYLAKARKRYANANNDLFYGGQ